jgi:SPP1 gp7 family putative phage head morphogenesis protein
MLEAIRRINAEAYGVVGKELTKELRELAEYEVEWQGELFRHTLPIDFDVIRPDRHQLKAAVEARPFQGALLKEWIEGLETARYHRLRDAIRIGYVEGQSVDQLVRRVRGTKAQGYKDGVLDISRRSAEAMVRTAVNATATHARDALYAENTDLIKSVRWVSTLDNRTTPVCRGRDGKVYPVGKGPRPPAHINCRSTTVPVTKSFRELGIDLDEVPPGTRASMDGQVPAGKSYSDWLRGKSEDFQADILGKKKAKLFRDGKINLDRFVDEKGREYTLEELRRREREAWNKAFPGDAPPKPEPKPRPQPKPKPAPKPQPKPQFGTTIPEELERHERHFAGSPQSIRDVVAATAPLASVTENPKEWSYYRASGKQIQMAGNGAIGDKSSPVYGQVWRHEYGHHVDYEHARPGYVVRSLELADVIEAEAKALVKRQRAFAKNDPGEYELLRRMREASDTTFGLDGEEWRTATRKALAALLEGTGIAPEDLLALDQRWNETDRAPSALHVMGLAARFAAGDITGALQRLKSNAKTGADSWAVLHLADLIGAVTKEKVGFGHGAKYYKDRDFWKGAKSATVNMGQATEAMANYFALAGGSSPAETAAGRIARALVPKLMDAFDRLMAELAGKGPTP